MSRYARVENRTWADEKFRALSRPIPNAQSLFLYLLTGPHAEGPGCFEAGEYGLAEKLRWPIEGFRAAMAELIDAGMVRADWEAQVVWVVNTLKHDPPANGNVLKHWLELLETVPECALKTAYLATLQPYIQRFGLGAENGMANGSVNGSRNRSPNSKANPEPEPIPEQLPKPEPEPETQRGPARKVVPESVRDVMRAITKALAYSPDAQLSAREHDRLRESAEQIVGAGGTPAEVPMRAERYAKKYPSIAVTHGGLAGHWGELASEPTERAPPTAGNGQYLTAGEKTTDALRRYAGRIGTNGTTQGNEPRAIVGPHPVDRGLSHGNG